jgi:hypothetical protein
MNEFSETAIAPEPLSAKIADADNLRSAYLAESIAGEPRLLELFWFLQWHSCQPGGLEKFCAGFVQDFVTSFGPACLYDPSGDPALEQCREAWRLLSAECQGQLIPVRLWRDADKQRHSDLTWYPCPVGAAEKNQFDAALCKIPAAQLAEQFARAAKAELPSLLRSLCAWRVLWSPPRPWWCKEILSVLFEAMEAHTGRIEQQLARTQLVEIVFDRLDFAWKHKRVIKLDGDARSGKSEAITAAARMNPGRWRLVSVPPGSSIRDLIVAIAESFGIAFTPSTSIYKLKEQVRFTVQHSRLGIIFDEAQFLLPPPSSRTASPARLDWVRCNIVDKKLPCALVCTPQNFRQGSRNLERNGYNFAQVLGRIDLNVSLPTELSRDDLLAVVKIHGADIPESLHAAVANKITIADTHLKAVESICCRAKHLAERAGRPVCQADIDTAVIEVIPVLSTGGRRSLVTPAAAPAPSIRSQTIATRARTRVTAPAPAPPFESPRRAVAPAERETVNP